MRAQCGLASWFVLLLTLSAEMAVQASEPSMGTEPNLVANGDFSRGLDGWSADLSAPCGANRIEVVREEGPREGVLEVRREGSRRCGGRLRVSQDLWIDLAKNRSLELSAEVMALAADVRGGCGDTGREYPILIGLSYRDAGNAPMVARFAFYIGEGTCGRPEPDGDGPWFTFAVSRGR